MPLRLNVLDQAPIPAGSSAGDALRNTLELARLADRLGYHRYWLAEHHGTPGLACNSPEVMIGPVAGATSRIRVGSGGIMLPHYSPLKVFESFAMLAGLYPGRIDLGLGRAPGTSSRVAHALQRDRRYPPPDDFREQLGRAAPVTSGGRRARTLSAGLLAPESAVWAAELEPSLRLRRLSSIPPARTLRRLLSRPLCYHPLACKRRRSRVSRCAPGRCVPRPARKRCA